MQAAAAAWLRSTELSGVENVLETSAPATNLPSIGAQVETDAVTVLGRFF